MEKQLSIQDTEFGKQPEDINGLVYDSDNDLTDHEPNKLFQHTNAKILKTSSNKNDCLIHSILILTSSNFRKLNEEDRNKTARYMRRSVFAAIPNINKKLMESENYLTDDEILIIANNYNIGLVVYIDNSTNIYSDEKSSFQCYNPTLFLPAFAIHYNGINHYSAIMFDTDYIIPFDIINKILQKHCGKNMPNHVRDAYTAISKELDMGVAELLNMGILFKDIFQCTDKSTENHKIICKYWTLPTAEEYSEAIKTLNEINNTITDAVPPFVPESQAAKNLLAKHQQRT